MADPKNARPGEDDGALLAVEATEPVILQEPDRTADAGEPPLTDAAPPSAPKPVRRQTGLLPYLIGAVLLAGAGFGAAKYLFPDTGSAAAVAALQTQLDAQVAIDTKLQSDIAAVAARPVPDATLADRIAALEAAVTAIPDTSGLESRLATLEDRLAAIEVASASGEGAPAAALAAMSRELNDLKAALEAQKGAGSAVTADIEAASAAAQARLDAAEAAAQSAARQAAFSYVRASFESGAPLGPALEGLKAMGAKIPETLAAAAEGLPSLLSLQEGFAEPARAALDASIRADMGDGWTDRLSAFLRTQSGARSLTPREGADPDAVLSRAEAALREGQIKAALAELGGLPPAGTEAMAPWIAEATRRLDAEQAIADLSAALNGQ
jgi:hypothetical protein